MIVMRSFISGPNFKSLLTNAPNPRKWWSTVKTAVFGASSSLPPLLDRGGKLVRSTDEKSSLLSAYFDTKQCRDSFQQRHSYDPSPLLCSVASLSSFVRSLLLDRNPYGRNEPDGMLLLFYKQVARKLAHKVTVIFRHLVKGDNFPSC